MKVYQTGKSKGEAVLRRKVLLLDLVFAPYSLGASTTTIRTRRCALRGRKRLATRFSKLALIYHTQVCKSSRCMGNTRTRAFTKCSCVSDTPYGTPRNQRIQKDIPAAQAGGVNRILKSLVAVLADMQGRFVQRCDPLF